MHKINFHNLDLTEKKAVFRVADEAKTLATLVTAAASHIGELFEAAAFMREFPKRTKERATLTARLQLGGRSAENILDCIRRAAPAYRTLADRTDAELDELLADLRAYLGTAAAA